MQKVFKKGEDIHTQTAMGLFGVPGELVTKDMRRDAKTINFGILYGLSSFGLSYRIGELSRADAKDYIDKYFETYPGVKVYSEQIKAEVNREGMIRNELGRIRKFPEIRASQYFVRQAAERAAINFPIQSLQADIIKIAMINIWKEISKQPASSADGKTVNSKAQTLEASSLKLQAECRLLLQVHDELVFEVREDVVEKWLKVIKSMMEQAYKLSVPVVCEAKVGDNWGQMVAV
jgi:DNA polymerase-1